MLSWVKGRVVALCLLCLYAQVGKRGLGNVVSHGIANIKDSVDNAMHEWVWLRCLASYRFACTFPSFGSEACALP